MSPSFFFLTEKESSSYPPAGALTPAARIWTIIATKKTCLTPGARDTQKTGYTSESPTLGSFNAFRPVMLGSHKTINLATFSSPPCPPVPSGNDSLVLPQVALWNRDIALLHTVIAY